MVITVKNLGIFSILAFAIVLAGCTSTNVAPTASPVQPAKQMTAVQPQTPASPSQSKQYPATGSGASNSTNAAGAKAAELSGNRVDAIYFHMNQRCVTCLCFEEHVNNVIGKYFGDAIANGKLTYRVLNAQLPGNAALARKYQVVGSQLFINSIVNGFDNIEDIQDIWNWGCTNNPDGFELKVKNLIEQRLKGQR
jgi:hypothetical protein